MAEVKKRASIRMGFIMSMQDIDAETDVVLRDHVVNVWGGSYERLELEEAVQFEAELQKTCGKDLGDLMQKVMKVATDFGVEMVIGGPSKPTGKPTR